MQTISVSIVGVIASTFSSMVLQHQLAMKTAAEKPSPTFGALLATEVALQRAAGSVVAVEDASSVVGKSAAVPGSYS